MDQNMTDFVETVNFIKDFMVANMVTKDEHTAEVQRLEQDIQRLEKNMDDHNIGAISRMGAIDNRIDNETFACRDLENRVRTVLPDPAAAPERV